MLKFFASSVRVEIGTQYLQLAYVPARWRRQKKELTFQRFDIENDAQVDLVDISRDWDLAFKGLTQTASLLDITLDDALLKYFIVVPPANAKSLKDYHAAALMRFELLYGAGSEAWQIVADWQAVKPSLVYAIPKALLAAICESAKKQRQHILSMQPRFVRAWNIGKHELNSGDWFGVIEDQSLILAMMIGDKFQAIKSISIPEDSDDSWLIAQTNREAMLHQLPSPERLMLIGKLPGTWHCDAAHVVNGMQMNRIVLAQVSGKQHGHGSNTKPDQEVA